MWYVEADWNGIKHCWWGAFENKVVADELANQLGGTVYHEDELKVMREKTTT